MNRRHVVLLLTCAALIYACTPRSRVTAESETPTQSKSHVPPTKGGVALTVSPSRDASARAMSFAIELTNAGKLTEVRFASGKTHDFVVLDERDREVWRWSDGRLFTQTLQTRQLKTGDAIRYEANWSAAKPGTYRVVAQLNSDTNPVQVEREFVVR